MKFKRVLAVARKEAIHVLRDPRSLAVALAIPALMLFLFGYALTLDVDNVPLAIWDQSNTPDSRELVSGFTASRYFSLKLNATSYREIEHAIDSSQALIAVIIPRDFAQQLNAGRAVDVQVVADGSDANTATIALGYAEAVTGVFSRAHLVSTFRRRGSEPPRQPLETRARMWFNSDMESRNYIIPALIPVIMMVIAALLTSLTVAREWERGTMEQLISTPVRGPELIVGKLIPYFVICMVDVLFAVVIAEFLFHVPFRGSLLYLAATTTVFMIGTLSIGIVISISTKSQLLASQMALILTFVPGLLLSGFMTPISNMPDTIQLVTRLVPARYFVTMLRGIYLKGVGPSVLWREGIFLLIFSVIMIAVAITKFQKKLV
jgi:ABC-2 type transport system permease protein